MKKTIRKKKPKSEPKRQTLLDRLPKNRGELLELMIRLTDRAITNPEYDKTMVEQSKRLNAELQEWKKSNS